MFLLMITRCKKDFLCPRRITKERLILWLHLVHDSGTGILGQISNTGNRVMGKIANDHGHKLWPNHALHWSGPHSLFGFTQNLFMITTCVGRLFCESHGDAPPTAQHVSAGLVDNMQVSPGGATEQPTSGLGRPSRAWSKYRIAFPALTCWAVVVPPLRGSRVGVRGISRSSSVPPFLLFNSMPFVLRHPVASAGMRTMTP